MDVRQHSPAGYGDSFEQLAGKAKSQGVNQTTCSRSALPVHTYPTSVASTKMTQGWSPSFITWFQFTLSFLPGELGALANSLPHSQ